TFPLGIHYEAPKDELKLAISKLLMTPGVARDRLTTNCYIGEKDNDPVAIMERAFIAMYGVRDIERKLAKAVKAGTVPRKAPLAEKLK
ncbi:acyl-CoA dehydrogenase domain-containing protein, partial [Photobacterium sp. R1]